MRSVAILMLTFSSTFSRAYAPEPGKVMVSVGPFVHSTDRYGHEDQLPSSEDVGYALLAEANVGQKQALELGLFFINKTYYRRVGSSSVAQSINRVYIPTGFRYWWSDEFSTALSFFSSYSMGDPNTVPGSTASAVQYPTSAQDIVEYGADASLRYEMNALDYLKVFFDGRYSYSLTPKENEQSNHFGLFIAVCREFSFN